MKLFLILLGHEHDEGTVISPILTPAVDMAEAETIAERLAEHLGVEVMEAPALMHETKCGESRPTGSTIEGGC